MIDWLKSSFKGKNSEKKTKTQQKTPYLYILFWKGTMPHSGAQSWAVKFSTGQTLVLFWHAAVEIHSNI